jgi:hypothetical protein
MSTAKIDWQPESEDLALAKDMVKSILGDWDWISWSELLASDVVLPSVWRRSGATTYKL